MDLRLRARLENEITILEVGGEIDLHSAPRLRAELLRLSEVKKTDAPHLAPRFIVDLREVSFIDSTGIGVLVGALKRARERGGTMHFSGSQARVKRVFEITGLMRALPLFETRDEALAAFLALPSAAPSDSSSGSSPDGVAPDHSNPQIQSATETHAEAGDAT